MSTPLPWSELVPGLWRSEYTATNGVVSAAFALRLKGGEVAVISPPSSADDAFFASTEALGSVTTLVAPNSGHDLGLAPWQGRYPDAGSFAPEPAVAAIAKGKPKLRPMRPVAAMADRLPAGVAVKEVGGTSSGIAQFTIDDGANRVIFVDEGLSNMAALSGPAPFRFVFWLTGSGPGIARNKVWWTVFAKDKGGVARQLLGEMDRLRPTMLVPMHGEPITGEGIERARALLTPLAG